MAPQTTRTPRVGLGGWFSLAFAIFLVISGWRVIGPTGPVFAAIAHIALMFGALSVSPALPGRLTNRWFDVTPRETRVYRRLGVRAFGRFLNFMGWTRAIQTMRQFDGTRAGLPALDQHTRRSELAHVLCWIITIALAVAAAALGYWVGAAWLIGLGIPIHLYPVALQRMTRARLEALSSAVD